MTNKEILEKAIRAAIEGGWNHYNLPHWVVDSTAKFVVFDSWDSSKGEWKSRVSYNPQTEVIIFNHQFAKALWGDEVTISDCKCGADISKPHSISLGSGKHGQTVERHGWQFHLQQMVISDDPVKYLGEHI